MADKARWFNTKTGLYEIVRVDDLSIKQFSKSDRFKCINPNCNVDMNVRNSSNGGFAFSSYPGQARNHVDFINCIRSSLVFNSSNYCEGKFDFNNFIGKLMCENSSSPSGKSSHSHTKTSIISNDPRPAIRGLSTFYKMICQKDKNDLYNNIRIGDMFCDTDNYSEFAYNPIGFKDLECSYYCPVKWEQAFYLNFPLDNRLFNQTCVKIIITDRTLFFHLKDDVFKNSHHIEPLIVAGEWIRNDIPNSKYIASCTIYNNRQIAYLK